MNKFIIQQHLEENQKMYFVWKEERGKEVKKEQMKKDDFGEGKHEYKADFVQTIKKFQYQYQIWEDENKIQEEQLWRSFNFEHSKLEIKQDSWNQVWVDYRIQIPNKEYSQIYDMSIKNLRNNQEIMAVLQKNFFNNMEASEQITFEERENGSRQIVLTLKETKTQEVSPEFKLKKEQNVSMNSILIKFDVSKLKITPRLPENDYEKVREENIKLNAQLEQQATALLQEKENMKIILNQLQQEYQKQIQEILEEKLQISTENQNLKNELTKFEQEIIELKKQNGYLQQEITLQKSKKHKLFEENLNLRNDIDLYLQRILDLEKTIVKQQDEQEACKIKIQEQLCSQQKQLYDEQQSQMLQTFNKNNIDSYSSNLSDLKKQKELIFSELPDQYQQELEQLFKRIIVLHESLETPDSDYIDMEDEYKKKIKIQQQKNEDLEATLQEYERKVVQKSKIIANLQEELKAYQIKINELSRYINQDQIKIHLKQIESQMSQIENYEKQIKTLQENLENEKKKYFELQRKFEEKKQRANSLFSTNVQILQSRLSLSQKLSDAERIKERALQQVKESIKKWMHLLKLSPSISSYKLQEDQILEEFIRQGKVYIEEFKQDEQIRSEQDWLEILEQLSEEIISSGIQFYQEENSDTLNTQQNFQTSCQIQDDQDIVYSQQF